MSDDAAADGDVVDAFAALTDALVLRDVRVLHALLDARCTVLHLSGVEQSKAEWLADVDEGTAVEYDAVDPVETAVRPFGRGAVLTVRTVTVATLSGVRAHWRLQLRLDYERRDGVWIVMRFVTTSW